MKETELIEAVKAGECSTVESLLDSGADVNHRFEQGWTALSFAAGRGDLAMVKLLVERGADIFSVGRDNRTPYQVALAAGRVDVMKYLSVAAEKIDPDRAKLLSPERKYCKAFKLGDLRKFASWSEGAIDARQPGTEFSDEKIVFVHNDFSVTESMKHGENVIFDQVTPEWRKFCLETLDFKIPDDFDLIAAAAGGDDA